jgi:hypothetical protein
MGVEAGFDLDHLTVSVVISIGSLETGASGVPDLFRATITDLGGASPPTKHLGDLPIALHRPLRREPRDLPVTAEAL